MFDTFLHRWLHVPYPLNVRHIRREKNAKQTILLIHGIGDTGNMWNKLIDELPKEVNVIAVDLLGFGDSPRPSWDTYDARTQARSLLATYLRLGMSGPVTVVGHSLGSLVAIDFARRYPLLVQQLILCAPPIYQPQQAKPRQIDDILREIYALAAQQPELLVNAYEIGQKLHLINPSLEVTSDNIALFTRTLHASIINQRTIDDLAKVKVPITIISGLLDPFVIRGNFVTLRKQYNNIRLIDIPAGHSVNSRYQKEIIKTLS